MWKVFPWTCYPNLIHLMLTWEKFEEQFKLPIGNRTDFLTTEDMMPYMAYSTMVKSLLILVVSGHGFHFPTCFWLAKTSKNQYVAIGYISHLFMVLRVYFLLMCFCITNFFASGLTTSGHGLFLPTPTLLWFTSIDYH